MFDSLLSFSSLRVIALISHFILTTTLLWTRYDCIMVGLKPGFSLSQYRQVESQFEGIISFGIVSLIFEIIMIMLAPHSISLFDTIKLFLDLLASFIIVWMVLDGLHWRTYIFVLVICVLIPTYGDVLRYLLFLKKNIWVPWRNTVSIFDVLEQILRAIIAVIWASMSCVISLVLGCFSPPPPEVEQVPIVERVTTCIMGSLSSCGDMLAHPFAALESCLSVCSNPSSLGDCLPAAPSPVLECLDTTSESFISCRAAAGSTGRWLYESTSACLEFLSPRLYEGFQSAVEYCLRTIQWIGRQIRLFFR